MDKKILCKIFTFGFGMGALSISSFGLLISPDIPFGFATLISGLTVVISFISIFSE